MTDRRIFQFNTPLSIEGDTVRYLRVSGEGDNVAEGAASAVARLNEEYGAGTFAVVDDVDQIDIVNLTLDGE